MKMFEPYNSLQQKILCQIVEKLQILQSVSPISQENAMYLMTSK